jgi:4-amino-4-deoxy-L-arabinose transferase-like glycosyltransferase
VDHPVYPLAIAGVHALRGGAEPEDWQNAGQAASMIAGVLLVVPLYLVGMELFGAGAAWLGVFAFLLAPQTGPILADVLSEGTFLNFWTWAFYAALRFLRKGAFGWLPLVVLFGGLAYLTRPEGVLLPAALVLTLLLIPLLRSTRMNWPRWWAAVGLLVVGPALVLGPYVMAKGGLATKPAVAKLLGVAPRAAADAVERAEPLDPDETELVTNAKAVKAVVVATATMVSPWMVPLAAIGLFRAFRPLAPRGRVALFVAMVAAATAFALQRLYVTGGYCTPRHAITLGAFLSLAAGFGLQRVLGRIQVPGRLLGLGEERLTAGPAVWAVVLLVHAGLALPTLLRPVNHGMVGYRQAASWLEANVPDDARVADATGWSLFYSGRSGYTFRNLGEASTDPDVRWVVVRDAHVAGPWWYCKVMRELVGLREPIATFPPDAGPDQSKVYVFDRATPEVRQVSWEYKSRSRSK